MLDDLHIPPSNILFAGDSAGGGLCLALLMYLRDNAYPLPAGAILMSPWVDLTRSCDSWDSNAPFDIVPIPSNGDHLDPVACYLGSNMERYLTHPYASPLFGDFTGLPPLLIQAGESEVLRDEVTLLAHKATLAGVQIMHELYEDAIHVFQAFPFLEASQHAFSSCRAFVRHGFALAQPQDPRPLDVHTKAELANEIDNEQAHMVRGDGQDKVPSVSKAQYDDSEQDSADVADEESDSSYVSAEDSLSIQIEVDSSWPTSASKTPDIQTSDEDTEEEKDGPSNSRSAASRLKSRSVQSYHGFEQHVPSLMRTQHSSSLRSHSGTLSSRHLRISSLSSTPVPSPSIRSSTSHPDISSLCQQWESTGPANVTLTYKPSGTTISASPNKPKIRKRSPTFHHT